MSTMTGASVHTVIPDWGQTYLRRVVSVTSQHSSQSLKAQHATMTTFVIDDGYIGLWSPEEVVELTAIVRLMMAKQGGTGAGIVAVCRAGSPCAAG
jgi:hypothetical protein